MNLFNYLFFGHLKRKKAPYEVRGFILGANGFKESKIPSVVPDENSK
jgi:hypothetical protein